jgi:type I restriction enzyme S subunit
MKAGWKTVKLGDVCHVYQPETLSQKQLKDGPYPVYGANGQIGFHNEFNHAKPQLTLGCRGTCGAVNWTTENAWINGNAMVVKADEERVTPQFLTYALKGGINIDDSISGTAQPQITRKSLTPIEIPLPPLAEQKRIVALLDEAFAGIDAAKAKAEGRLANSHALFVEYLRFIFEQNPNWSEDLLGDVCEFENGDRGPNYPNRNEYVKSGIPWINAGHIQSDGKLSKTEMNFITLDKFQELRSGKIKPGDLVYCLRGAIGKTAVVEPLVEGAIASSLVIIRPSSKIDPLFLYFFLISPIGQSISKKFENGAAQPNLGAKSLAKYPITYPTITEQKKISGNLASFRDDTLRLAGNSEQKLLMLKQLKVSLLQKAFAGELVQ